MEDIYEMMMNEEEDYDAAYEDGVKEGSEQKTKEIVKNLLNQNIDINIISVSTGLSIQEINSLM